MALIGGFAGRCRGRCREATSGASVVELEEEPVAILTDQRVVGGEEDVAAIGADSRQARAGLFGEDPPWCPGVAGTEGDQLRPAVDVLVDVLGPVGVGMDQSVFGGEEGTAVV